MHVLLFSINFNNFKRFQKSKSITFKVDKISFDKSTDSNVFNGGKKSTDIAESVCEKNVRILPKNSVPEFIPTHRNFRPAPSNPRKKLITRAFFVITRLISDQIALHSVQLPL